MARSVFGSFYSRLGGFKASFQRFSLASENPNQKSLLREFAESSIGESSVPKACLEASVPGGIFFFPFFISVRLGCDFTPLAPPTPNSRHPWNINISTSQSIFILKHMANAACGCEDTWLLFIHLIYLYFFPEGETLVSIHLR